MKTEQEQIKEMMLDVPQTVVAYDANPRGQHLYGEQRLQIAEILYDKGYGDVSEYKAEIERLQSNTPHHLKDLLIEFDGMGFAPTTVCPNPDKYATEWRDRLVNCVNNATKQAKIDVLNELKGKMFEREYMGVKYKERIFYESEIDDMIAEVQNAEDKG